MLSEVLSRSCHFLSTPSLETQASALACMRDCVLKLATAGADAGAIRAIADKKSFCMIATLCYRSIDWGRSTIMG